MHELPFFNQAFAAVMRSHREAARKTQLEIAFSIGGSESYVRRLEGAKQTPTSSTLILVARAMGLSPDIFLKEVLQQMSYLEASKKV